MTLRCNVVYYLHGDHLGSTSLTTDESGDVVSEVRYHPYGQERWANGEAVTDFGFTSQRKDGFGLYDYNARYYSAVLGRFVSPDTIVPEPGSSGGFNRYRYTRNNPLRYTDPTGHCAQCYSAYHPDDREGLISQYGAPPYSGPPDSRSNIEKALVVTEIVSWPLMFVGGDIVTDGGDALLYAGSGQYGNAAISGAAAAIPAVPGKAVQNIPGAKWVGSKIDEGIAAFSGACSFSPDTLVATEDGLIPISLIENGQFVLAYDENTGKIGYYPVTAIWSEDHSIVVLLTIEGELIETTPEHPFYTAEGEWVAAGALTIGDQIRQADDLYGEVETIQLVSTSEVMYNLTIAEAHTYFVGDGQWLVHNTCLEDLVKTAHDMKGHGGGNLAAVRTVDASGNETYIVGANYYISRQQRQYLENQPNVVIAEYHSGRHRKIINGVEGNYHAEEVILDYLYGTIDGNLLRSNSTPVDAWSRWTICDRCQRALMDENITPLNPRQ